MRRRSSGAACTCCLRCLRWVTLPPAISRSLKTIKAISGIGDAHVHLDWAAIAIIFAIPFDALDGRIARMTNTTSEFGKELDSLADVITFGMAPSLLAFDLGISLPALFHQPEAVWSTYAKGGSFHLLPVSDWRGFKAGAFQHQS